MAFYASCLEPSASVVHCNALANALCLAGHDVSVYLLAGADGAGGLGLTWESGVRGVSVSVEDAPADPERRAARLVARLADHLRQKRRVHHIHHAHDWLAASALFKARDVVAGPVVRTLHRVESFDRSYLEHCQAQSVRGCDLTLAVSDEVRRTAYARYRVIAERVDNGVDFVRFAKPPVRDVVALGSRLALSSAGPVLFSYGGVSPRKNTLRVLQAFLGVRRRLPSALWVIAGADDTEAAAYLAEFEATLAEAGEDARRAVYRAGILSGSEMAASYQLADAVVCASSQSGFGLCALEALAAGAPLVAPQRAPFIEYLDRGCADLIDVDDVAELERVLTRVLVRGRSEDARIGAGMDRARRHNWSRVAVEHLQLYRRLLATQGGGSVIVPTPRKDSTGVVVRSRVEPPMPRKASGGRVL